jgi:threonine/homoserine/homoserine lactone efflux protein
MMTDTLILHGLITGLLISLLMFGPSFFMILKTTLHRGLRNGLIFSSGSLIADIGIFCLVYSGISLFYESYTFKIIFSLAGGSLILFYGIKTMTKGKIPKDNEVKGKRKIKYLLISEGFLMNALNPAAYIMWVTVIGTLGVEQPWGEENPVNFIPFMFLGMMLLETLKVFIVKQLGLLATERLLMLMIKVIGIILIALSARIFYSFVMLII